MNFLKNKKAISGLVASIMMIALVVGLIIVVWGVVNNLVGENIESSKACFGNFGKVTINNQYSCHDTTLDEMRIALTVGDIEISGILVAVAGPSGSKSAEITEGVSYNYVRKISGSYSDPLNLPGKNSGLTYVIDLTTIGVTDADTITIAPIIGGNQCEASDTLSGVDNCNLLS